ncbi:MAG: twin-arginine translocase TatA/TatE family subunit [Planctomycetes bacterium]|nr:twin-arginine translocase TatA/TatE family subunit [Planctomycetota bacterium]
MIASIVPGGWQWLIILVVVLLLFGRRIPELARSLGSGITEFKKGLKTGADDDKSKLPPSDDTPPKAP